MDTEIIMLRGALHDKEQELADLKTKHKRVQEICKRWAKDYLELSDRERALKKKHISLKQLVGELKDFHPDNARVADVISRLMEAIKDGE